VVSTCLTKNSTLAKTLTTLAAASKQLFDVNNSLKDIIGNNTGNSTSNATTSATTTTTTKPSGRLRHRRQAVVTETIEVSFVTVVTSYVTMLTTTGQHGILLGKYVGHNFLLLFSSAKP
jgi:hypothetical protein